MGLRLLILFIVIALLVWLLRRALRRPQPPPRELHGRMLRCAHCGLHVPADEAVMDGDTPYCCADHRQAGPQS